MSFVWKSDKDFYKITKDLNLKHAHISYDLDNPVIERLYNIFKISQEQSHIDGDFAECGVYYGGTAIFMETQCKTMLHLFDSWQGISELTEYDNEFYKDNKFAGNIIYTIRLFKDSNKVRLYRGWIPDRFKDVPDVRFSLVHLDLDLYNPTKASLEFFMDRMSLGGKIVCDTHEGTGTGVKKAIDELFDDYTVLSTGQIIISF